MIPIVLFLMMGAVGVSFSPLGRAIGRRIGGATEDASEVKALRAEVADLRAEVDEMRSRVEQLDDVQNRLDFAERMLAQVRQKNALPGSA
jgi:anti-sigma-K factor RskA